MQAVVTIFYYCIIFNSNSRWFEPSSGAIRTACDIQIDGRWEAREAQANMEETDGERLP